MTFPSFDNRIIREQGSLHPARAKFNRYAMLNLFDGFAEASAIYEVRLRLLPAENGDDDGLARYVRYLDVHAGTGRWVMPSSGPLHPDASVWLFCPAESLLRLKWADIVRGYPQMQACRRLADEEKPACRLAVGEDFPWEVEPGAVEREPAATR